MDTIPIIKELNDFKEHLKINERTIFSAKFGDGKTHFLNAFKKKYSNKDTEDKYYFITLYPVNYSVVENQDIFEYIKRDILLQLAKDGKLNPIDFEGIAKSIFTWENLKEVIGFLISFMPKGEILNKILEKVENFAKKYEEERTTFKKYDFMFSIQKGGLYEHDGYTELIIETLKYIKNSGYKTALIIEDLDRIDPAHLFRILNVLGAHIDEHLYLESHDKNKFGFDNIIIVFDYDTTKNIFHHFYGEKANYEGYINKFTSYRPFYYSINEIARDFLYQVIFDKCHISKASFRSISEDINNKLDSLSIRDVKTILQGIDFYIKEEQYGNIIKFNTKSTLTYTIVILKLLGIQEIENIKKYIFALPDIDLLNCINVFLLTRVYDCFKYNESSYVIDKILPSMDFVDRIIIKKENRGFHPDRLSLQNIEDCFDIAVTFINK